MSEFLLYLELGWHHILDWGALDHLLYLGLLAVAYPPSEWRKLLLLATAFTLGHSLTLALATLEIIRVPSAYSEFLIPFTIFLTALFQLFFSEKQVVKKTQYLLVSFFGLIHGLAFSNDLRDMLGRTQSIFKPLLAFNLGIEAAQILCIAGLCCLLLFLEKWQKSMNIFKIWRTLFAISALILSLKLMMEN